MVSLMWAAVLSCSAWVPALTSSNCSESQLSVSGRNDISGTWDTHVNDVQVSITHQTNASDTPASSYGKWELNLTLSNPNCTHRKNETDWNFDAIIIDVNSPRKETQNVREPRYEGYSRFAGLGLYKLHKERLAWADAVDACDEEQAYLAVVNSQREAEALLRLFRPLGRTSVPAAYLGLSDQRVEGSFLSVLGERLEELGYDSWAEGQPDGRDGEDCVVISRHGLMSDEQCGVPLPFICEAWLLD